MRSLAATGELPNNHYWNTLRARHDANPTRFDKANVVLGTLLDRDQLQREGLLSATAPLFTRTGFFAYAGNKHDLNSVRFDYWHPFLGRLFELILPQPTPAGQGLNPPATTPPATTPPATSPPTDNPGNFNPPPAGGDTGGGTTTPIPTPTPNIVPEPSSVILMSVALIVALVGTYWKRRADRPEAIKLARPAGA